MPKFLSDILKIVILAALLLAGCGSGVDLNGTATLSNGTLSGNATVQTPLGTFFFDGQRPVFAPSPSPSATP